MEFHLRYAEGHQCFYANTETMAYQADDKDRLIIALMQYIKGKDDDVEIKNEPTSPQPPELMECPKGISIDKNPNNGLLAFEINKICQYLKHVEKVLQIIQGNQQHTLKELDKLDRK